MPTRDSYDAGTPCWIDLSSPDVDSAKAFYQGLFGWGVDDQTDADGETWIYANFTKDGKVVCGLGAQQPEMAGMPGIWSTYVATDDPDAVLAKVEAAGGTVMVPTMQVMDAGHMAILADPTGAVVSLWKAGTHTGAQVVNETNTYAWNELLTRDIDAAKAFYAEVFGWTYDEMDMGGGGTYSVISGGPEGLGGLMAMPAEMPEQVPNHWGVYFTVADADATAARAAELGGTVVMGPMDSPVGRLATLHDPSGGSFNVMQPPSPE